MARMSEGLKVDIWELECHLLGPEESDVDGRHVALNARGEKHQRLSRDWGISWQSAWHDGTSMQECWRYLFKSVKNSANE